MGVYQYKENGEQRTATYILKTERSIEISKAVGGPREALFYKYLAPHLSSRVPTPKAYFAHGDMATGEKVIILEDIKDSVQSGYYFGSGSPHNLGKDLAALMNTSTGDCSSATVTALDVAKDAFILAANMHSLYWCNNQLLVDMKFLRGVDWLGGQGVQTFLSSQAQASDSWKSVRGQMKADPSFPEFQFFDPFLLEVMDSSFEKVSWEDFQTRLTSTPYTLCHSDYHPANMMGRKILGPSF